MRFGIGHLTDVLAGRETDKVLSFGHHRLSVFGIADEEELALVKPVARALLARDALRADDYGGLSFGPGATADPQGRGEGRDRAAAQAHAAASDGRRPNIRTIRCSRRCARGGASSPPKPACRPTSSSTTARLREMAESKPATLDALARVSGVGAAKLDRYGAAFIEILQAWESA